MTTPIRRPPVRSTPQTQQLATQLARLQLEMQRALQQAKKTPVQVRSFMDLFVRR